MDENRNEIESNVDENIQNTELHENNEDEISENDELSEFVYNADGNNIRRSLLRDYEANKKNTSKKLRIVIQIVIMLTFIVLATSIIFAPRGFEPDTTLPTQTDGFVAISYFAVQRFDSGSNTRISEERLLEHMDALHKMGYNTITQQQVLDYYEKGTPLPEKALLLMFEDGRRDTAVSAQGALEKYNYIATILSYADVFEQGDNKFLSPTDLETLMDSGYWELGTNGYRLEYINAYDVYRNFFGQLNSDEYISLTPYMGRDYNHYLMDFIRDEDRQSLETLEEMEERITTDYENMDYIYNTEIGFLPELYVLMHSNSDRFGNDPYVSDVNEENIIKYFPMNFNREGFSYNEPDVSIYDLTRMQPQANWYPNQLIMRISDDTGEEPVFVIGDEAEAEKWDVLDGAAEFRDDTIVLTSPPDETGTMKLLEDFEQNDMTFSVNIQSNVTGVSTVGIRSDESMSNAITVSIEDNVFFVRKLIGGSYTELYKLDLFDFDGGPTQSVEEHEKEGMLQYAESVFAYNSNYDILQNAASVEAEWELVDPLTLEEGGEGYVPSVELISRAQRELELIISENKLTVYIDGRIAIRDIDIGESSGNSVYLQSSVMQEEQYSQRNLTGDVYDAVFNEISFTNTTTEDVLYDYTLPWWKFALDKFNTGWQTVLQFFLDVF